MAGAGEADGRGCIVPDRVWLPRRILLSLALAHAAGEWGGWAHSSPLSVGVGEQAHCVSLRVRLRVGVGLFADEI